MNFPSIEIQGSILSADLLSKIRSEQASFQQGKDFNNELTNAKLKDEISFAWQEAKGQWLIFQSKLARLKENQTGTTETRNFWIIPLLTNLSYNLAFSRSSDELSGKLFPINYRDSQLDGFPLYIGSCYESLDRRPENKQLRVSPHAMLQEYLNYSEHLYGIVTNGKQLRLLRDASRITRLSYIEFNLEKMMEEDLYSDFVLLFRLLHSSRMPKTIDGGSESIIEKYHQESLEAGSTIRSKLGDAVKNSIKSLANGFINHPDNANLREAAKNNKLHNYEYYHHLLRIVYRLLFLFVIEERNLVFAESKTPETKRFNQIYFNYYSLLRLRKLAKKLPPPDAERNYDLWQGLVSTFALFEKKEIGEKMGIMSLEGELFSYDAICGSEYDLHKCKISNAVLLGVIKSLTYFENENKVLISVNYGGLDVEEFGSVYEGLLELKLNISKVEGSEDYSCNFDTSTERSKSGSHYTPEELVQPLLKHSLEYLIEDRIKEPHLFVRTEETKNLSVKEQKVNALLNLKVCDVACGSGHILLSAARRISLEIARIQNDEEQPNPLAIRKAMKDVVRRCIYGVDKNPLAVELCKVALWLEAHNPGEPLNFLDHHIKCGDSIVGLARREELERGIANEAFKLLPSDDKEVVKAFRDKNLKERKDIGQSELNFEKVISKELKTIIEEYDWFKKLPERTTNEVADKGKKYRKYLRSVEHIRLKQIADLQVAQFFIPKTLETKNYLITDAAYRDLLLNVSTGLGVIQDRRAAYAETVALEKKIFHWFLEFPDVFAEGGFDCILGNPPYLGGSKVSGLFGNPYLNFLHSIYFPTGGQADLVSYFLRRVYNLVRDNGFLSLITTNTISQSETKNGGLDLLLLEKANILYAISSMKWPGDAKLFISLLSIVKGSWNKPRNLNNREVQFIGSDLSVIKTIGEPYRLIKMQNLVFKGTDFGGDGFLLSDVKMKNIIALSPHSHEVIFPTINGKEINSDPQQLPSRYIINFFDWELSKASIYEEAFKIVEEKVKPIREINKRKIYRDKWWLYCERRVQLYEKLKKIKYCFVAATTTRYLSFSRLKTNIIFSNALFVFTTDRFLNYALIQNTIHNEWARKYSSSLKNDLRYAPTDSFETFPFPQNPLKETEEELEKIGEQYHEFRRQLMLNLQLGLTKTYNLFHTKQFTVANPHLTKARLQIPIEQAIKEIETLRQLQKQMDEGVLKAYGWTDINLAHDFYEVDYLPENDRIRYTISPEARKEILKRLLELNHKIHDEEVAAGLWDKKGKKKEKVETPKPRDEGQHEMF